MVHPIHHAIRVLVAEKRQLRHPKADALLALLSEHRVGCNRAPGQTLTVRISLSVEIKLYRFLALPFAPMAQPFGNDALRIQHEPITIDVMFRRENFQLKGLLRCVFGGLTREIDVCLQRPNLVVLREQRLQKLQTADEV